MKHHCVVKGCTQRGIWLYSEAEGAYCTEHRILPYVRHAWYFHGYYKLWLYAELGVVHEGRKVGKPVRAWAEARRWKRGEQAPSQSGQPEASGAVASSACRGGGVADA